MFQNFPWESLKDVNPISIFIVVGAIFLLGFLLANLWPVGRKRTNRK